MRRSTSSGGGDGGASSARGRVAVHAAVVAGVGTPHAGTERIHRCAVVLPGCIDHQTIGALMWFSIARDDALGTRVGAESVSGRG